MAQSRGRQRLVIVSNRLPYVFQRGREGRWRSERGAGGLVSALLPILQNRGGSWVGWPGAAEVTAGLEDAVVAAGAEAGFSLHPVMLTAREVEDFYEGFSNEIIWPLFHDLQSLCNFDPAYWHTYKAVNAKFAKIVLAASGAGDFIWVHDYHLMNVAAELRTMGSRARLGFFLHIPFPPPDIFLVLPWRLALLRGLLQYDLIGFQTMRDRANFLQCVRRLMGAVQIEGRGTRSQVVTAMVEGRTVRIGNFPISIDYNQFTRQASSDDVTRRAGELRQMLPQRKIVLGIDRLDYTKGIPHRLQAFKLALERYANLRERLSLIQVVVPSREDVAQYQELRTRIEQLVGQINGSFMRPGGWVPVWYIYGALSRADLLAYYRAAHIALVTPLKDGMNLVAKEFCACDIEEECVLVLSEFAGAAAQLERGALLVNPHDIEGVADALYQAFKMSEDDRRARMKRMRRSTRDSDIFWWCDSYLRAAIAKDLSDFPQPEGLAAHAAADYVPPI